MYKGIVFKGDKNGIRIICDKSLDFNSFIRLLSTKLEAAATFFTSEVKIYLPNIEQLFSDEQQEEVSRLFAKYGLCFYNKSESMKTITTLQCNARSLIVEKTLRSGQEIVSDGCVEIFGDVNPGARVIAGGNIVIHGICRGMAHAGARGNRSATITADKMRAIQLRIADMIARAPDHLDYTEYMERACVRDGMVVIEPAN